MASSIETKRTELDHRSSDSVDVTLVWVTGEEIDETLVCVRDKRDGAYFEITTEPYLALDVFHHPFAYADFASPAGVTSRQAA